MSGWLLAAMLFAMFTLGIVALGLGYVVLIQRGGRARFRGKTAAAAIDIEVASPESAKSKIGEEDDNSQKLSELEPRVMRRLRDGNPQRSGDRDE